MTTNTGEQQVSGNGQQPSDALVFFGATGDLAFKQIFPRAAGAGGTAQA